MAPNCSATGQACLCRNCGQYISPDDPMRVFVCAQPGCPFQSDDLAEVDAHRIKKHTPAPVEGDLPGKKRRYDFSIFFNEFR